MSMQLLVLMLARNKRKMNRNVFLETYGCTDFSKSLVEISTAIRFSE
jgi:hypothetical protein